MGAYKYIRASFQQAFKERTPAYRTRLSVWRKQKTVTRTENPTSPLAARRVGFKARPDFVVARVRMKKGNRARRKSDRGKKPGRTRKFVEPAQGWQRVAEQRAASQFRNLTVKGSYFVGEDGMNQYFEVVLHNPYWPSQPSIWAKTVQTAVAAAAPAAKK